MKMAMADGRKSPATWPDMMEIARKAEEEAETESSGSSEAETESPRSVGRWGSAAAVSGGVAAATAVKDHLHSQVLRIREEELCVLVEDKAANYCDDHEERRDLYRRRLNLVLVSRPILPCSPLSGKVSSFKAVK